MIGTNFIYAAAGLMFVVFAVLSATDHGNAKRFGNAGFYALLSVSFLFGDRIGDIGNGVLVLGLVAIAGSGAMGRRARGTTGPVERQTEAAARGNRLFLPALVIPATALLGTFAFTAVPALVDPKQITLVALTCGVILALAVGYAWFRPRPATPFAEGLRLMDSVGWAAVLPQMLASLGAVFALAGVGQVVGGIAGAAIPDGSLLGAVLVYTLGMAAFTMVMGNAFAAFPVMTAAIGVISVPQNPASIPIAAITAGLPP